MPATKKKPLYFDAAMHIVQEVATKQKGEILPGHHNLKGVRVTFDMPDICFVDRAMGTSGPEHPGYNDDPPGVPQPPVLTLNAAMLFIERALAGNPMKGPAAKGIWKDCCSDDHRGLKAAQNLEAEEGLKEWHASLPPLPDMTEPSRTKTPAKRTGVPEVIVTVGKTPKPKPNKGVKRPKAA
jgi:hypothetical protein